MAKYLLLLILLLLNPIRSNDALAQSNYCYCIYPNNDGRCYANTACWACAPGAYNTYWQQQYCLGYQAPQVVTCTTTFAEKTESCPVHYSGIKKYKQENKACTDGTATQGSWQLYSNTCTQDPPTCQVSSQTQTLSCETGYTGSITQTRSSTCPDPYGNPVWQPWVTTSNTCVKSITNPTNVTSPVSPVSPVNPTSVVSQASSTSALTTQSSVVTAPIQNTAPSSDPTPTVSSTTSTTTSTTTSAPTTTASQTTSSTPTSTSNPPPKGKMIVAGVGLALSLEIFVKSGLTQPSLFVEPSLVQNLPLSMLMQDKTMMDLMFQPTINQHLQPQDLGFEQ